jgi:hypothetical protein
MILDISIDTLSEKANRIAHAVMDLMCRGGARGLPLVIGLASALGSIAESEGVDLEVVFEEVRKACAEQRARRRTGNN